jgi:hypothetical protein
MTPSLLHCNIHEMVSVGGGNEYNCAEYAEAKRRVEAGA